MVYLVLVVLFMSNPLGLIGKARGYVVYREEWKWTPIIQVHAPRYGYAQGTVAFSSTASFTVYTGPGSIGYTSYASGAVDLYPDDGKCLAYFQLCLWRHEYDPIIGDDVVRIADKQNWFVTLNIHDGSRDTCEDDLEEVSWSGYTSVRFKSRYTSWDHKEDNPSNGWTARTVSVGSGGTFALGPVTVVIEGVAFTGTFEMTSNIQITWKYWFGPGHGWYVDYLGNNYHSIWTFKLRF